MFLANTLNPRVVYNKGERNGNHLVPSEAWSVSCWDVSICGQMFGEMIFGYHDGLENSIQSLPNYQVNIAILSYIL